MQAKIIVQGIVQGVGYRFYVLHKANEYSIKGYVRNLPDGTVEVIAQGNEGLLNDFINQLKIGPASAQVNGVSVEYSTTESAFDGFKLKY
jgi:acylphosphatase